MKKKILIDASTVTSLVDGLSNYIINLIRYLPSESFMEFEYTILINKGLKREQLISHISTGNFKILETKIAPIGPKRDWDMFWFLLNHRKKYDLIHITSNNYPFSLSAGICTIHDITFKKYFDHPRFSFNLATVYMNAVIKHCIKKCTAIIAVSNSTKMELAKWYKLDSKHINKIKVIYEGWEQVKGDDLHRNQPEPAQPPAGNYIFYLGTFRVHKNISGLLSAFLYALNSIPANVKLAISGSSKNLKKGDLEIFNEINKNGERVYFTGYLPDFLLGEYFKNADCFIFPSLSEGFGLPVLEAFYFQTPVLCSNLTSIPEVAGNAAIYFDPYEIKDIANAIIKFYSDPSLAQQLVDAGNEQLKKFSWEKTARETVQLYRDALD